MWPIKVDPSQIDQILTNLVVNARDAIESVGRLTIETHAVTIDEAYCAAHSGFAPGDFVLLITDVIMPEMNGRDLSQKLISLCPGVRCLFMSGYTGNVIAHHGVLDEGVNFIQKPFTRHDLAAKVREVLDGSGGWPEERVSPD